MADDKAEQERTLTRDAQNQREDTLRPRLEISPPHRTKDGFTCRVKNVGGMTAANIRLVGGGVLEANTLRPDQETTMYFEHPGGPMLFEFEFATEYRTVYRLSFDGKNEIQVQADRNNTLYHLEPHESAESEN